MKRRDFLLLFTVPFYSGLEISDYVIERAIVKNINVTAPIISAPTIMSYKEIMFAEETFKQVCIIPILKKYRGLK